MERLQKVLAQAGLASRRAAEQIILAGRVRVDGKIVRELGTQVDPRKSRVEVDGNKIVAEKLVYIVLHKPRGVVCTLSDPEGRPTIRELLHGTGGRVVPVGRLDFHTSGALLCTNDGEFAQALAHPKREVPKVYVAKVKGAVDDDALERFGQRIVIDGRPTQPAQVKRLRYEGDKTWLEITLREGRNRQVRRLGEATGFPVMRLARLSHAGVTSEDLRPGQWRELTVDELVDLKKNYGVPKKVRTPSLDYTKGKAARGEGPAAKYEKVALRKDALKKKVHSRGDSRDSGREGARDASREGAVRGERFSSRKEPARGERAGADRFSTRKEPSGQRGERAGADRFSNRKEPSGQRGERFSNRKDPVRGERAQSARHDEPNRPWQTRSRSASEARPQENRRGRAPTAPRSGTDAGRHGRSAEANKTSRADRAPGHKRRRAQ